MQVLRSDIERHSMDMKNVDHTGTYLKYFGSKQDTVYVRNRLSSVRLRWKRLLRRVDETNRRLDRALRDAKRVIDITVCVTIKPVSEDRKLNSRVECGNRRLSQKIDKE